jgi:hypothetical protein
VVSVLLSIRQKIMIPDFSPYLLTGIMIAVSVFYRSLRVRMKRFQRPYRIVRAVVVIFLAVSTLFTFLHRPIYRFLGNPHNFFVAPLYEPYDMAMKLKKEGKKCFSGQKGSRYQKIMKFYGFQPCK